MYIVGKIDKNIFECVTANIATDNVVMTDNQILHIKDRHPNDYELFSKHFADIVSNPDYIIKDKNPNTAIILKEILENNQKVQLVLRLVTNSDPDGYMNSIITFLRISEKRWERYLRTKEVLYKKE